MSRKARQLVAEAALLVYSGLVIRLLVFKFSMLRIGHQRFRLVGETREPNLLPFKTIVSYMRGEPLSLVAMLNVAGNVVLFVPIGLLALLVFRTLTWRACLALAIGLGLVVEGAQAALRVGIFDVDDLILNALGVMVGYGVCRAFVKPAQVGFEPA